MAMRGFLSPSSSWQRSMVLMAVRRPAQSAMALPIRPSRAGFATEFCRKLAMALAYSSAPACRCLAIWLRNISSQAGSAGACRARRSARDCSLMVGGLSTNSILRFQFGQAAAQLAVFNFQLLQALTQLLDSQELDELQMFKLMVQPALFLQCDTVQPVLLLQCDTDQRHGKTQQQVFESAFDFSRQTGACRQRAAGQNIDGLTQVKHGPGQT